MPGNASPMRNQIQKELPLIAPIAPVARPKTTAMTMNSKALGHYKTRIAQTTPTMASTTTAIQATAATTPITTLNRM